MKNQRIIADGLACLMTAFCITSCSSGNILNKFGSLEMQEYLCEWFDYDHDHKLSDQEAASITKVDLWSDIKSLKGIKYLKNLEVLRCNGSPFATIDLSKNECLREFSCESNENLKVIKMPQSIQSIHLYKNAITELKLGKTPFLTSLYCGNGDLQKIKTGFCPYLTIIDIDNNYISEIDLSKYPNLVEIFCDNNHLTRLDVSDNPYIETIRCKGNKNIEIICRKGQIIEGVTYNPDYNYCIDKGVKITYID
mgnify:FL=1